MHADFDAGSAGGGFETPRGAGESEASGTIRSLAQWVVPGRLALRREVARLGATSSHLVHDIGQAQHPLAPRYDAEDERRMQAVRVSLAGW